MHDIPECPQIVTIRLDGPLYFGSVEHVEHEFEKMRRKRPGQKHVIFYLKGVGKVESCWGRLPDHGNPHRPRRGRVFPYCGALPATP
jgi:hypothetical protein